MLKSYRNRSRNNVFVHTLPFFYCEDGALVGFPGSERTQRSRCGQDNEPGDIPRVKRFVVG